jgi:hypothetical protein
MQEAAISFVGPISTFQGVNAKKELFCVYPKQKRRVGDGSFPVQSTTEE